MAYIGAINRLLCSHETIKGRLGTRLKRSTLLDELRKGGRDAEFRSGVKYTVLVGVQYAEFGLTNPNRVCQYGLKDRLQHPG